MLEAPFTLTNHRGWPIRGVVRRLPDGGQAGLVVQCHGFKGFMDWGHGPYLARRLAEEGFTAVSFNFSGSGIGDDPVKFTEFDRFRENTLTTEVLDLEMVLQAATTGLSGVPAGLQRRPALLGHSRGGLIVLVVAGRQKSAPPPDAGRVGRVITWAGVGLLRGRWDEATLAEWRRRGSLPVVNSRTGQVMEMGLGALEDIEAHLDDYDPRRVIPGLSIPSLIIHGTADTSVPFSEAEGLYRAAGPRLARLVPIEGADHTFGAVHPFRGTTPRLEQAIAATISFLREPETAGAA
jgi:uncharacterized protein